MSLRLPSRMVTRPRCLARRSRRCNTTNPAGPHASKKALCGLTTGTSGATRSSTRAPNSSKARATADKAPTPPSKVPDPATAPGRSRRGETPSWNWLDEAQVLSCREDVILEYVAGGSVLDLGVVDSRRSVESTSQRLQKFATGLHERIRQV